MKILVFILPLFFSTFAQASVLMISDIHGNATDSNSLYYDFGLRPLRSQSYKLFTITNASPSPLTFKYIISRGSEFRVKHDCKSGLLPNEKCLVEVEYNPKFEGYSTGIFEVNFSEIDTITITVRGLARK